MRIARRDAIARANRGADYRVHEAVRTGKAWDAACGRRFGLDVVELDRSSPVTCRQCIRALNEDASYELGPYLEWPSGRKAKSVPAEYRGATITLRRKRKPRMSKVERAIESMFGATRYRRNDVLDWAHAWVDKLDRDAGEKPAAWHGAAELYWAIKIVAGFDCELVCAYCDAPGLTVDHVHARKNGGGNARSNVTPACQSCNSSKGHRPITPAWLAQRARMSA